MPYLTEHSAQIKDLSLFKSERSEWTSNPVEAGVRMIMGYLTSDNGLEAQSYRFKKDKFSPDEAKKWLKSHKIAYDLFEPARNDAEFTHALSGTVGYEISAEDIRAFLGEASVV